MTFDQSISMRFDLVRRPLRPKPMCRRAHSSSAASGSTLLQAGSDKLIGLAPRLSRGAFAKLFLHAIRFRCFRGSPPRFHGVMKYVVRTPFTTAPTLSRYSNALKSDAPEWKSSRLKRVITLTRFGVSPNKSISAVRLRKGTIINADCCAGTDASAETRCQSLSTKAMSLLESPICRTDGSPSARWQALNPSRQVPNLVERREPSAVADLA